MGNAFTKTISSWSCRDWQSRLFPAHLSFSPETRCPQAPALSLAGRAEASHTVTDLGLNTNDFCSFEVTIQDDEKPAGWHACGLLAS